MPVIILHSGELFLNGFCTPFLLHFGMDLYGKTLKFILPQLLQICIESSFIDIQEDLRRYEIGTTNSDTKFHSGTVLLSSDAAVAGSAEPKRFADRVIIARTAEKENRTTPLT